MKKNFTTPNGKLTVKLATYTAAAGAMMLTASQANGQVFYSGIRNMVFDMPGILNQLDLDGDGITDFNVGLAWSSTIFNSWISYRCAFIQNAGTTNGWIGSSYSVYQLAMSSIISSGPTWTNYIGGYFNLGYYPFGSNFIGAGNALMGIRFISFEGEITGHYGWMRINIERRANELIVVDWAYEQTPVMPILAGVLPDELVPPEPYLSADIMGAVLEDFPIEVHFTEPISGFTTDDIAVTGGSVVPESLSTFDNQHFEVVIHPEIEGIIEIKIPGSVVQDADGNLNMPGANGLNINYIEVPKPVFFTTATEPVNSEFGVAIAFNEPVTGLEETDFVITNGILTPGSLTAIDELHFSIMITPLATGHVLIDLPAGVLEDSETNANLPAETLVVHADFDSPRTELYSNVVEPVTGPFTVFIEFSEAVEDLQEHEVDITNGFVSAGTLNTEDNILFSLDIIPEATGDVIIQVPAGVAHDIDDYGNLVSEPLMVAAELPDNTIRFNSEEFVCYPNPTNSELKLQVTDRFIGGYVGFYNASGSLVFESIAEEREMTFDLSGFSKGIYLIKIRKDSVFLTKKLIIE